MFTDVIAEIDWSAGEILKTLRRLGPFENTLVLFTSDNGPWLSYSNHAGSAAPLREGKGTAFEGGSSRANDSLLAESHRIGNDLRRVTSTIDVLPTLAKLAGAELPVKKIDGRDIWPLLSGQPDAISPHEAFYLFLEQRTSRRPQRPLEAALSHSYRSLKGKPGRRRAAPISNSVCLELYNLDERGRNSMSPPSVEVCDYKNWPTRCVASWAIRSIRSLAAKCVPRKTAK
ncbi:MAG: sulfatase-like hydrolase/transferase [Pirellulaceae bacterium]